MSDKDKGRTDELPTKQEIEEANVLLKDLRESVERKDADTAEVKEKVDRIEDAFADLDKKNDSLVAQIAEQKKNEEAFAERFNELEAKLTRMSAAGASGSERSNEIKAWDMFCKMGQDRFATSDPENFKYLRTDNDREGGFLAPPEYIEEILKNITEISPVRQVARIRQTSRSEIQVPKRTNKPLGGFFGEGGDINESNQTYGLETVRAHNLGVIVIVTTNMLTDAAFNIEAEINTDVAEFFAEFEGASFINGTNANEPEGLMQDSRIQEISSGIANDLDADNFFDLQGELKTGYTGTFMMNRRTLARVRKLKGSDGQYLFAPFSQGAAATIAGDTFISGSIDMDDIAAGTKPVAYGDFLRGYTIVDGVSLSAIRDPFTQAGQGKVRFIFHRRVGGKVMLPEAIKHLIIQA